MVALLAVVGAVLHIFLMKVRLQFTDRRALLDPLVVVRDEDGNSVAVGPPVVAEDEHRASGTYAFGVGPSDVSAPVTDPIATALVLPALVRRRRSTAGPHPSPAGTLATNLGDPR